MVGGPSDHADRPGARGHPTRVATTHRQTRRALELAALFAAAALGASVAIALDSTRSEWWLPLHLFLVGSLLLAISGVTQMLAVTWSTAPPTSDVIARIQQGTIASGAIAVAIGREAGWTLLAAAGGLAVVAGLVLLGLALVRIRATAVTDRFHPAIDAYLTAAAAGIVGASLAIAMVTERVGARWLEIRAAHLTVNLLGLVGLVIAGTLPYFLATQIRSKMHPRATGARLRTINTALAVSVTLAAIAQLAGRPGLAAIAIGAYGLGLIAVVTTAPIPRAHQRRWAGPRLVQLAFGIAWWIAMTFAWAASIGGADLDETRILRTMVIGGFAPILLASLAYLAPVIRAGGHQRLSAGFAATRSWPGAIAGNLAALGAITATAPVVALGLGAWGADTGWRALRFMRDDPATTRSSPEESGNA